MERRIAFATLLIILFAILANSPFSRVLAMGYDNGQIESVAVFQNYNQWNLTAIPDNNFYEIGELVTINGTLTYNSVSVANVLVSVTIFSPFGETVFVATAITGQDGKFSILFRPLDPPTWPPGVYTFNTSAATGETNVESAPGAFFLFTQTDFNHDGKVNFSDIVYFVNAYISFNQNGTLDTACDLNHDGVLNFRDIALFVEDYLAAAQTLAT